jgi:hypothetical protein
MLITLSQIGTGTAYYLVSHHLGSLRSPILLDSHEETSVATKQPNLRSEDGERQSDGAISAHELSKHKDKSSLWVAIAGDVWEYVGKAIWCTCGF